jgi:hypothetical protein
MLHEQEFFKRPSIADGQEDKIKQIREKYRHKVRTKNIKIDREIANYILDRVSTHTIAEIVKLINLIFKIKTIKYQTIYDFFKINDLAFLPRRPEIYFSAEQKKWIFKNCHQHTIKSLTRAFNDFFNQDKTTTIVERFLLRSNINYDFARLFTIKEVKFLKKNFYNYSLTQLTKLLNEKFDQKYTKERVMQFACGCITILSHESNYNPEIQ